MIFNDRREAGRALAQELRKQADLAGALVLALPRGGLPVAAEVARELQLPLDIFVVRKLGVPGEEELAMGAVASGGIVFLNSPVIRAFSISQEVVDAAVARERQEVESREALYRETLPRAARLPMEVQDRTVIVVDDGLATGSTMKAAVLALRPVARRIIAAVPVSAAATAADVSREVDQLICLHAPARLNAVGECYRNFDSVTEDEMRALLAQVFPSGNSPDAA
jgi:putative phosphoribosyl transferase